jgi:lactose/L-arabinose transport system permease protein
MAGYGFEVFHSKYKDRLMSILLLSMMIPFAAIMIPLFSLTADMGLLGTTLGFILPTLATAFLIMLFRQSARYFPHDMIEAARIDGLSEVGIFFRMFMPTMKSTYAAAIVITFMAAWSSYLWPVIIFRPFQDAHTMPLIISNIMAGYVIDNGVLMLAVMIATLPTIIIFFLLQRYFAEGIVGTIK